MLMFKLKLHKYFYSFILLVSLASFTGYATTSNSTITITELVEESNNSNRRSIPYSDYLKGYSLQTITNHYKLYCFYTLLYTQNSNYTIRLHKLQLNYSLFKKKQDRFFLKTILQCDSNYFSVN